MACVPAHCIRRIITVMGWTAPPSGIKERLYICTSSRKRTDPDIARVLKALAKRLAQNRRRRRAAGGTERPMKQKRARRPGPLSPQSGERYGEGLVACRAG